jgi:hypothetical protein
MIQSLAWEERNYIEQMKNFDNKRVSETKDTTIKTKTSLMQNDWRDIIDPKLRKKMKMKAYYEANKDKINLKKKLWEQKNKDKRISYFKEWYIENKQKVKSYREENKDKIKNQKKDYKNRTKNIPKNKILKTLRRRLKKALDSNQKSGNFIENLGCSINELKIYLESKFQDNMSWDNYGLYGWHIDHIRPLASFDLSDKKQILEACHYTNLQPLWAKDNLSKSDNY